jgi:hypothetical protein
VAAANSNKVFAIELESIRFFIITTSTMLTSSCLRLLSRLVKPPEPGADSIKFGVVDPINAGTASLLVGKQSGLFQDAEVPARRGPGTTKSPGDLAGSHAASSEPDYEKNVTPRGMGQSGEDHFCFCKALAGVKPFHRYKAFNYKEIGSMLMNSIAVVRAPIGSHTAITSGVW